MFSSYKHSHCHKQTNSLVVAFHIWKWLILPSWQSIKHLCFLTVALAPILVIQPFSFYFSFQNSLCCDSFYPSWTQKYSYHFWLLKKKKSTTFLLLNFLSCLIFRNSNPQNLSVGFKQVWQPAEGLFSLQIQLAINFPPYQPTTCIHTCTYTSVHKHTPHETPQTEKKKK